jgi:hypothetical protein
MTSRHERIPSTPAPVHPAPAAEREHEQWISDLGWLRLLRVIVYKRFSQPPGSSSFQESHRPVWLIAALVLLVIVLLGRGQEFGQIVGAILGMFK